MIRQPNFLYAELQKLIEGLPDDAIKVVLELEVERIPRITVTRACEALDATATATVFKVTEIKNGESEST